jgi:hypothetical protein
MRGRVASLNAAVAGSVLLFEAASQREVVAAPAQPTVAHTAVPAEYLTQDEPTVAVAGGPADDEVVKVEHDADRAATPEARAEGEAALRDDGGGTGELDYAAIAAERAEAELLPGES